MIRKEVGKGNNKKLFAERQKQVISLIRDGLSNKEIADKLGVSCKTVENTIRYCLLKSECYNRTHLVICALRLGEIGLYDNETNER
jgi:DNA-binding NarL/FixJ family response regulator